MKQQSDDPIFTTKGVLLGGSFLIVNALIVFSMDPEWVAWAGPMAMGALYVPNQPPPLFSQPEVVFQMASTLSWLALSVLVALGIFLGEAPFGFLHWLKAWLKEQIELDMAAVPRALESAERNGNV